MNIFEQELRRLAKACAGITNPVFAGRACYGDLGAENRVKLQFVTLGHADHYEALKATILNRAEGEVDTLLFRFSDVWGAKQVSNPNFREGVIPHIWKGSRDHDWYAYRPTDADIRRLAAEVGGYVAVFTVRAPIREQHRERPDEKESVVEKLREAKQNPAPRKAAPKKERGPEL